jgi:TPR repeat protein
MYLLGQGIPVDGIRALKNFERSCAGHFGESCVSAAMLYHRGVGGIQDEELSQRRFQQGCELGYEPACRFLQSSALR